MEKVRRRRAIGEGPTERGRQRGSTREGPSKKGCWRRSTGESPMEKVYWKRSNGQGHLSAEKYLSEKRDVAKIVGCWKRGSVSKRAVAEKVEEKNNSLIIIY